MATNEKKKLDTVKTPRALGCYVFLKKARAAMEPGREDEYSATLLWPKTTNLDAVKKAILDAAVEKFGPNAAASLGGRLRSPLRDGDEKFAENGDVNFKGKLFINAKNTRRPGIVDAQNNVVDPAEVFSGCYFHAALRFFGYDKKGNKGVAASLQNLMLVGKGPRIDGGKSADKEFEGFTPDVMEDEDLSDMV